MRETVLITGGNGDIAQAIREVLLKDGNYLVLAPGKDVLDVTNEYSIKNFFNEYQPDILINAAGFIEPQTIITLDSWSLRKHIDINLCGAMLCSSYAISHGVKLIINIGSSAGIKGKAGWSAYCVSKAGLTMFNECLNAEGVNSFLFSIGRTRTKMRKRLFPSEDESTLLEPFQIAEEIKFIIVHGRNQIYKHIIMYRKEKGTCIELK